MSGNCELGRGLRRRQKNATEAGAGRFEKPAPDARAAPPEAHESLIGRKTVEEVPLTGLSFFEKRLTVAEAEKLSKADHDLCLFGLSGVSADVAAALQSHRRTLRAPGLMRLDGDVAAALARHAGPVELPDLRRLDSVELARKLVAHENKNELATLYRLPHVSALDPAAARTLATMEKWDGDLPGLTAFDSVDAVAVAAALATRDGRLALPNLKKISSKTLTALVTKKDVEIPFIETLELISEPDGSATEDFIIPGWLAEREDRQRLGFAK